MAATKTSAMDVREQLKDITECCVCSETYQNPKILPCVHTFCMKCLEETGCKTSKNPGDQMPCPMCRKEFTIPEEGFIALQKNFFMEKLIEMAKIGNPSEGSGLCEACMADGSESTSEIPLANMYCKDCEQKLCEECSRHHRKNKLTKNHEMIATAADFQVKVRIVPPCYCKNHNREFDLYCSDCKKLMCKLCFGEGHQNHRLQDVRSMVEGFKNEIKDSLSGLEKFESDVLEKRDNLKSKVEKYCENLENFKPEVLEQKVRAQRLVGEHADLVLQGIDQLKVQKRKEVEAEIEDTDRYLTCLESFKVYCNEVMNKGSASDICCAVDNLKARAEEIIEQHDLEIEERSHLPEMFFQMSDMEELAKTEKYNVVGCLKECQMTEKNEDETVNQSNDGNTDVEDDGSAPMPVLCNSGILPKINQLKEELENERHRISDLESQKETLERRISQLAPQVAVNIHGVSSVNYRRPPNLVKTLQGLEVNQSRRGGKIFGIAILDDELFLGCFVESSVVEVYDTKTLNFKRRWQIEKMFPSEVKIPMVVNQSEITTPCNNNFRGLVSCTKHKYLYSCVSFPHDPIRGQFIQRTDVNGSNAKEWKLCAATGVSNLSVTREGNIIVINDKDSVIEYSKDGELVHDVHLPWSLGIIHPMHALKVANGDFLISHGLGNDRLHRVLALSENGEVNKSFEVVQVAKEPCLNEPVYLAMDVSDNILIADRGNNRIVVLNSNLEYVCLINNSKLGESWNSPTQSLQKPHYMCVDTAHGQLFVCEDLNKISVLGF